MVAAVLFQKNVPIIGHIYINFECTIIATLHTIKKHNLILRCTEATWDNYK